MDIEQKSMKITLTTSENHDSKAIQGDSRHVLVIQGDSKLIQGMYMSDLYVYVRICVCIGFCFLVCKI